jgi:hypothetical protein
VHYRDLPDTDGGDTIRYQGVGIVDKGSQSDSGNFNDKPAIAGDIARGTTSASVCGPVYIAFTIFTGGGGSVPFTTKLGFSRSTQGNCGSSWSHPIYLNKTYKHNQGATLAVDPGTGKIYVVWRHVFQAGGDGFPDSILMVTSSDGGSTFSDPVPITRSGFAPFDQPGLATTNFPKNPAFRSNSFPTIAMDGNGNVYVADQEKTFPTGGSYPPGYYEPRVIIRTSTDGGSTWTTGSIVDSGSPSTYAQQFMPVLSFGGGLLKLMWYDFREQNQASDNIAGGYYVTGFDRQMKTYIAQSTALNATNNPVFGPSVPVSQYLIDVSTQKIPTVANVSGGYPAVNRPNLTMYNGGTNAFTGDYIGHATASPFVPNPGGTTAFRWATKATDFIAMPSFGAWTDSRDVVFPTLPIGGGKTPIIDDTTGWQMYAPPGTGLSCINAGSRNANVYLSEIKPGVIAASPATSRQLVDANNKPIERAFPIYIQNPNSDTPGQMPPGKFFRVSFNNLGSPVSGSFAQGTELTGPTPSVDLEILQYSSAAVTLYVFCPGCSSSLPFAPFEATVQQTDRINGSVISGGFQTAIFFDSDPTAPFVTNANLGTQETHGASVSGPVFNNPANPTYNNPTYNNPTYNNPTYNNPTYNNAAPSDFAPPVGDFVWQVTDVGNNASAYTALVNIAQSQVNGFLYELIVSRAYNFPGFNVCQSQPIPTGSIISIIPNPTYNNPTYNNPTYNNPTYNNPTYNNASFAAVPPPPGSTSAATASATTSTSTSTASSTDDGTTKNPLATDHVYFVLRVYRADGTTRQLTAADQANIIANTSLLVFPQAPNTGQGQPMVQPPAPANSNKVLTSTSLASSQNPSVFGQPVTFTATVTPKSGSGTPTGFVDFKDGSTLLQTVPVSGGAAALQISLLGVGTHAITALYSGDTNFVGSISNALSQMVNKANTTTSVTSNANPSVFGQAVTFIATATPVAPGAGTPNGSVTFADGGISIGSAALSGGVAQFTTSALSVGSHAITASYNGDSNFIGSNSANTTPLSQAVNAASTSTALTSSANSVNYLQPVSFTATVSVVLPGAGSPSGSVNFFNRESKIGSGTLSGGVATLSTSSLPPGSDSIRAIYVPDTASSPDFIGSTSNIVALSVVVTPFFGQTIAPVDASGQPDLVWGSVQTTSDGNVKLMVRFASGTFNSSTTVADVELDTDQNPSTGSAGSDSGCTNDGTVFGDDYFVEMQSGFANNQALIFKAIGGCNNFAQIGTATVTIFTDGMDVTFPLTMLTNTASSTPGSATSGPANSGPWNFKVTTFSSLGGGGFTGVQDYMPAIGQVASTASAPLPVTPPSGMLAWFPADGYPTDIQSAHGELLSSITYGASEVGQSFVFNGLSSFITVTDSGDLTPSGVTVDFWFNSNVALSGNPVVPFIFKLNPGDDANAASKGYDFFYQFGALGFGLPSAANGTRTIVYCGSPACQTIAANTWHHVTGTYDTTSGQLLYFDGQLVGSGSPFGSIQYQSAAVQFGVVVNSANFGVPSPPSNTYYFNGQLDEIEILNRALSASEIQAIYNAGSAGKAKP